MLDFYQPSIYGGWFSFYYGAGFVISILIHFVTVRAEIVECRAKMEI